MAASKLEIYKLPQVKSQPSNFFIYKDPNPHSLVVKKLSKNARWIVKLSGVKKYSRSTWLHVSWNNNVGWMKKSFLVFDSKATEEAKKNPRCVHVKTRVKSCSAI